MEEDGFSFEMSDDDIESDAPVATPDPVVEKVSPTVAENETELSRSLPNRRISTFTETYYSEHKLKFWIPNVLPETGLVFFGGLSGTGKTILAIQVVNNLVMNRPTMTWFPIEDLPQLTVMMLSLEMSTMEWHQRVHDMYPTLTDEEDKLLGEHFLLYSEPEPIKLWDDNHVADLIRMIARNKVNVVLIDSASVSLAEDLTNIAQVNKSLENLYTVRVRLNVAMIMVAHTRKSPAGMSTQAEDISINDLFGHSGIAQFASSIFLMYEDEASRRKAVQNGNGDKVDKIVHIVNVKTRFGSSNAAFKAKLPSLESTKAGKSLLFRRDAIELPPLTEAQKKSAKSKSQMSDALDGVDFGSILSGEDDL